MILYPNTKVYIICAGGIISDNVELCHRLCSQMIRFGIDAKLVYVPVSEKFDPDNPVQPAYKSFHVPYTYEVEDSPKNVVIVPETLTTFLYTMRKIRRVIWWLSVDNFFRDTALRIVNHFDHLLTSPMAKFFCFQSYDSDVEHWTQSDYAKRFLQVNGVPDEKIYSIGDFISPELVKLHKTIDFKRKKNTVVFNAASDANIISRLKSFMPKVDWIAIQDSQAVDAPKLLTTAKIYVDFSDHPSKNMMPRRAAILGCVVITNKKGAAANNVDLNIPAEFKFDVTEENLPKVAEKIREVLKDCKSAYAKQKKFLDKIIDEQKNFARNVAMTLGVKAKTEIEPSAIFNGLNETGAAVAEILSKDEVGLEIDFVINDDEDNEKNSNLNVIYEQGRAFLTLSDGKLLPIISSDDARFLYNEGRIKKIILLTSDKQEEDLVTKNIQPLKDDIISTNFEE